MPPTKRGIYHNLKESKYTTSNDEVVLFFSSEIYLTKFLDRYKDFRKEFLTKIDVTELNMSTLADIKLYKIIEKRGFRACLKGIDITQDDLHKYALRKMTEKQTLEWKQIDRPKPTDRIKEMSGLIGE